MSRIEPVGRGLRKLRTEGGREAVKRVVRRAYQRLDVASLDFPLLPGDLADSATLVHDVATPRPRGTPLTIGWLTTPPGAGSGGHTTMFRMVQALEAAGHRCVIQLYDRHHGAVAAQAAVIARSWPWIRAEVRSVDDGFRGLDACVATSWQTAHVLGTRSPSDLHRFYFIQDFEPFFHAHGSQHELAADSYRFGFHHLALGHMVQDRLRSEVAVDSHLLPFSCDTSVYSRTNTGSRTGVVFYAKPDVPRRGYLLGALALEHFHRRHPDQEIHVYGDPVPEIATPVTRHGRLTPSELNTLYNTTRAGIAMSFTNISLVAEEMLAAGTIPIVNDSPDSRADLPNEHARWAAPTPVALADALGRAVEAQDGVRRSAEAAASVRRDNWGFAGSEVVRILQEKVHATADSTISVGAGGRSSPARTDGSPARATP